ncbi:MAG TPA: acetyl-CoA carboxylase biotin carboxylase subunit [Steroidobacteraceae bacterium]|nr:acetyl-CoA carboxylase biotin carboxylase subunit [Steroidobacteraceae bacterium]
MFSKLLIANRGEIACRIARTARRLGIRTVAVYSDADAKAAHVAACDEAVRIGGALPRDSYLRGDVILEAARRTGAQAIHPGYGFLSENAEFARACAAAGMVFVGPTPAAIEAMGSKSAAKALMEKAGVPLTPGYHGDRQEPEYLLEQARRTGFPVLIKAVAGGGGKGMRRVDAAEHFIEALAGCRREAQAAFGDDRVLVEKYLSPARHVEVQVFGDTQGGCVYLFERDCSVQRRHQKVIEEAPAPGMTPERRQRMGEAAVAAARAVEYTGAGTVEFIVGADGAFYFMEMNTRLQVEHPVTEMITGLDLVDWQLRVAAGEPLPLAQSQLAVHGHAIEARVYAEDPAREFLPSIGTLEHLATPETSADLRIDTGVRQGDEITPYYDPMIAKLIVHGATRAQAVAKLRAALADFHVAGVRTNVEFLHRLTSAPSFVEARLDTGLIERERAHLLPPAAPPPDAAWALAARAVLPAGDASRSPWDARDGWRLGGRATRNVRLRSATWERNLALDFGDATTPRDQGGAVATRDAVHVFHDGAHHAFTVVDPYLPTSEGADAHGGLTAPMPGRILSVLVTAGERVARGAPLMIMEAMKMEHTVKAPADGVVEKLMCGEGDQVREGAELLKLAPA